MLRVRKASNNNVFRSVWSFEDQPEMMAKYHWKDYVIGEKREFTYSLLSNHLKICFGRHVFDMKLSRLVCAGAVWNSLALPLTRDGNRKTRVVINIFISSGDKASLFTDRRPDPSLLIYKQHTPESFSCVRFVKKKKTKNLFSLTRKV